MNIFWHFRPVRIRTQRKIDDSFESFSSTKNLLIETSLEGVKRLVLKKKHAFQ